MKDNGTAEAIAILSIPFLVSAAIAFLPVWISAPTAFVLAMLWLDAWMKLPDFKNK